MRDIIRTDDNFPMLILTGTTVLKSAAVKGPASAKKCPGDICITQGLSAQQMKTKHHARAGRKRPQPQFSPNLLDAESQTIWKDVETVMSADPKQFQTHR